MSESDFKIISYREHVNFQFDGWRFECTIFTYSGGMRTVDIIGLNDAGLPMGERRHFEILRGDGDSLYICCAKKLMAMELADARKVHNNKGVAA